MEGVEVAVPQSKVANPLTALGQLALLAATVGAIYLLFRYAVVIPPAGYVAINVAAVIAVAVFAWRAYHERRSRKERRLTAAQTSFGIVAAASVVIALTLPLWILLYLLWLGSGIWR